MWIEKSVPRVTVRHHKACQKVIPRDRFFYPHQTAMKDSFSCTSCFHGFWSLLMRKNCQHIEGTIFCSCSYTNPPHYMYARVIAVPISASTQVEWKCPNSPVQRCLTSRLLLTCCGTVKIQTSTFLWKQQDAENLALPGTEQFCAWILSALHLGAITWVR